MKTRSSRLFRAVVLLLLVRCSVWAITWDFTSGDGSPADLPGNITGGTLTAGNLRPGSDLAFNTTTACTLPGSSGTHNAAVKTVVSTTLDLGISSFFEFTLTPLAGYGIEATSLSFNTRRTANGPTMVSLRSSLDNFLTSQGGGSLTTTDWTAINVSTLGLSGLVGDPVTFRIYGAPSASATTATWRIDDLVLNATAVKPMSGVPDTSAPTALLAGLSLAGLLFVHRRTRTHT